MRTWVRIAAVGLVGTGIALIAACDDGSDYGYDYSGRFSQTGPLRCGDYKACGTCTPVIGCGWCSTDNGSGNGTGTCTDGPDNCSSAPTGFNWDPTGCPGVAEGGTVARDGGHSIAEAGISTGDDSGTDDDASSSSNVSDAGTDSGEGG